MKLNPGNINLRITTNKILRKGVSIRILQFESLLYLFLNFLSVNRSRDQRHHLTWALYKDHVRIYVRERVYA